MNALSKYHNLRIVSRDRGKEYQAIDKKYIHIADRFHLIMNLSQKLTKSINDMVPHRIAIETSEKAAIDSAEGLSASAKNKIQLIQQVKDIFHNNGRISEISRNLKLDRRTVTKYITTDDVLRTATYSVNQRSSSLDPHKDAISRLYSQKKRVTYVHEKLKSSGVSVNYRTLSRYIKEQFGKTAADKKQNYISRTDVIKYIFFWRSEESSTKELNAVISQYPVLKEYRDFYCQFKASLTALDRETFINLIEKEYGVKPIDNFIAGLKKDYEAVVNAATYQINNGITEGYINKLKLIKRDMYGRASLELLRRKIIYQTS